jgi:predicted transcriptional regulator of viral defense system
MNELKLKNWVEKQLSLGKYGFAQSDLLKIFPNLTRTALKYSLIRLSKKKKIISLHKGYYLIIPPQYESKAILPPSIFLDSFMKHLNRSYYLSLLNAAAYHGASHQQPQEFFVVTGFPVLRPTVKNGLKINYISKKEIPEKLIEIKKTESGYLRISNPVLTIVDLIHFQKRVGGMNRVAVVLDELLEAVNPEDFSDYLIEHTPVSTLQRLGYLLDIVFKNKILADSLNIKLLQSNVKMFRIPLKNSISCKGFKTDERWKVIINAKIELDE